MEAAPDSPDAVWRIRQLRGPSQFARQCLANLLGRVREVEQAHMLDVLTGEAASKPLRQVRRQPLNQRGSILSPLLPRLLELNDAMTDQPIRGSHGRIHRTDGRFPGGINDLRHFSEDGLIGSIMLARFHYSIHDHILRYPDILQLRCFQQVCDVKGDSHNSTRIALEALRRHRQIRHQRLQQPPRTNRRHPGLF